MRQSKFRGKHIRTGWWLSGSLIVRGERRFILPFDEEPRAADTEVDPITVGEYLDELDKNGREVCEGDLVYAQTQGGHIGKHIIGWGDRRFIQIDEQGYKCKEWLPVIEVFGNIHDTPESVMTEVRNEAPPKNGNDPWRCEGCGSQNVQQRSWTNPNNDDLLHYDDCDRDDYWCEDCEEHEYFVRESELMKDIEDWFANHLCPDDIEVITGLERDDFASDGEFDAACKEKWDALGVEGKINAWREQTRDKSMDS